MSLPNSTYTTTSIFPQLNEASKQRHFKWSRAFWLFWNSAILFAEEVQVVLVHIDEKWFYAIVIRRNNKYVPHLGIEPVKHDVHHKSHIYKVMGIANTAFAPHNNDMTKGGCAEKVSLTRVSHMVKAKKDTYLRVYHDDCTFTYPKIAENLLRRKGQEYFEPLEINGSVEQCGKKKKFSLLKWFLDVKIPRLKSLVQQW